jgi:hypothetical protein
MFTSHTIGPVQASQFSTCIRPVIFPTIGLPILAPVFPAVLTPIDLTILSSIFASILPTIHPTIFTSIFLPHIAGLGV